MEIEKQFPLDICENCMFCEPYIKGTNRIYGDDALVHQICRVCCENENQCYNIYHMLKDRDGHVSVPFSWLVKFCTHIDFKKPMTDEERGRAWKEKLDQQFGIKIGGDPLSLV